MRYIMAILTILAIIGAGMAATYSDRAKAEVDDGYSAQASASSKLVTVNTYNYPDISVSLSVSPTSGYTGTVFHYNYTVKNNGAGPVYNLTINDTLFGWITLPKTTLAPGERMSVFVNRTL